MERISPSLLFAMNFRNAFYWMFFEIPSHYKTVKKHNQKISSKHPGIWWFSSSQIISVGWLSVFHGFQWASCDLSFSSCPWFPGRKVGLSTWRGRSNRNLKTSPEEWSLFSMQFHAVCASTISPINNIPDKSFLHARIKSLNENWKIHLGRMTGKMVLSFFCVSSFCCLK